MSVIRNNKSSIVFLQFLQVSPDVIVTLIKLIYLWLSLKL